jgi:hypothetical protein
MGRECDQATSIRGRQGGPAATLERPTVRKTVGCIWCALRIGPSS